MHSLFHLILICRVLGLGGLVGKYNITLSDMHSMEMKILEISNFHNLDMDIISIRD